MSAIRASASAGRRSGDAARKRAGRTLNSLHAIHMMRLLRVSIGLTLSLVTLSGCEDGIRAKIRSSRTRDSSLARDLEIAQRRTSATRTSDGRDSGRVTASPGMIDSTTDTTGAASPLDSSARTASNVSAATPSADGYIGPSCASPALDDQRRCLLGYLARSDANLDRNYQALIGQLKKEASTRKGAPEPPAGQRLRTAQR